MRESTVVLEKKDCGDFQGYCTVEGLRDAYQEYCILIMPVRNSIAKEG